MTHELDESEESWRVGGAIEAVALFDRIRALRSSPAGEDNREIFKEVCELALEAFAGVDDEDNGLWPLSPDHRCNPAAGPLINFSLFAFRRYLRELAELKKNKADARGKLEPVHYREALSKAFLVTGGNAYGIGRETKAYLCGVYAKVFVKIRDKHLARNPHKCDAADLAARRAALRAVYRRLYPRCKLSTADQAYKDRMRRVRSFVATCDHPPLLGIKN